MTHKSGMKAVRHTARQQDARHRPLGQARAFAIEDLNFGALVDLDDNDGKPPQPAAGS